MRKYLLDIIILSNKQLGCQVKSCLTNKKTYLQSADIIKIEYILYANFVNLQYLALLIIYHSNTGKLK